LTQITGSASGGNATAVTNAGGVFDIQPSSRNHKRWLRRRGRPLSVGRQ
jgi:hypothetical protein